MFWKFVHHFSKEFSYSIFNSDRYESIVNILGLKTLLKHFIHYIKNTKLKSQWYFLVVNLYHKLKVKWNQNFLFLYIMTYRVPSPWLNKLFYYLWYSRCISSACFRPATPKRRSFSPFPLESDALFLYYRPRLLEP